MVASNASATDSLNEFKHIVVIYQENHSFDNLYGLWGEVHGDPVNGLPFADLSHTTQVRQDNVTEYKCLLPNDVNLTSPPLPASCPDNTGTPPFSSAFLNKPFKIDDFIAATDKTCPPENVFAPNGVLKNSPGALPGGCTRDLVHRIYSEQYQINLGKQNRYVTGSDAVGLVMGYYDTKKLPIYKYLHSRGAPDYVISDSFFQGAFGGSFLNHQWLVAAATPVFANAVQDGSPADLHSIVDANGMPTAAPFYAPTGAVKDSRLTSKCATLPAGLNLACGDYAVNTIQPTYQHVRTRDHRPQPAAAAERTRRRRPAVGGRAWTGPGTRAAGRTPMAMSGRRAGPTATVRSAAIPTRIRTRPTRTALIFCSSSTIRPSTISPALRRVPRPERPISATKPSSSQPQGAAS